MANRTAPPESSSSYSLNANKSFSDGKAFRIPWRGLVRLGSVRGRNGDVDYGFGWPAWSPVSSGVAAGGSPLPAGRQHQPAAVESLRLRIRSSMSETRGRTRLFFMYLRGVVPLGRACVLRAPADGRRRRSCCLCPPHSATGSRQSRRAVEQVFAVWAQTRLAHQGVVLHLHRPTSMRPNNLLQASWFRTPCKFLAEKRVTPCGPG